MLGNAGEWCVEVTPEGKRKVVLCGGHFECPAGEVTTRSIARPEESWQMSDPQIPKSRWWLSDAPFAGLRIVREFPKAPAAEDSDDAPKGEVPEASTPENEKPSGADEASPDMEPMKETR